MKPSNRFALSAALVALLSLWGCSAVPPPQNSAQPSAQHQQRTLYKSYADWLVSAATVHRQLMIAAGGAAESRLLTEDQLSIVRRSGKQLELALRAAQIALTAYVSGGVEPGFVGQDSTSLSEKITNCMQLLASFTQLVQSMGVK
jgi:hypothetical protein